MPKQQHLAEKLGIKYMETSAKTGNNVKELFHSIAKDLQSWGGFVIFILII